MSIGESLRIKIEQIKVIRRFTFLVVVANPDDQKKLLMESFLKMGNRMVLAMPWSVDFDANAMRTT